MPRLAGDLNTSAMCGDDGLGDAQAQSRVSGRAVACLVSAIEALEYMGKVLGQDAAPGIRDDQRHGLVVAYRAEADAAAVLVVLDRVRQEVRDDLGEPLGIAVAGCEREVRAGSDVVVTRERRHFSEALRRNDRQIAFATLQSARTGLDPCQIEQALDEPAHSLRRALARFETLAILGCGTFA